MVESLADALRAAWSALPDVRTHAGELGRQSLIASARQDPELASTLQELIDSDPHVICSGVLDGRMAVITARYGTDVLHGVGIDGVDRGGKLASAIRRIETQILERDLHDCD